jgi:SAM-dependent methyltransferase
MMQMRNAGWEVTGIEPDPVSASKAVAAGLDVRGGSTETLAAVDNEQFDAISLHHVFEHLHRPLEALQRCRQLLKPGGTIVIATPNFSSFGHRHFGPDWFPLSPPVHLVLFTADSLRQILENAGFTSERACRLRVGAAEVIRRSMQIQRRGDPMRMQPRFQLSDRFRAMYLAWRANCSTRAHSKLAEELVLLARR